MNQFRLFSVLFIGIFLFACSSNQEVKPTVEPTPTQIPVQEKKISLDTPTDRYSYALGMDLGKAIANVNVPIKMDVLLAAIQDEVDSTRKTLMSDSVSEASLQDLLLQIQKQKELDEKTSAKKSLDEQVQFLSKNILDSTVKTTPKGVQYKIIKDSTGISPKISDKVKVHYMGSLLDGTEFDNSFKRGEPLEFPVSAVIEGWQDLLQVMKEGMRVKAWIPSALAYGEAGVPPMIPANSLLVFEVELLKVYAEAPVLDSVSVEPPSVQDSSETLSVKEQSEKKLDEPKESSEKSQKDKKPVKK